MTCGQLSAISMKSHELKPATRFGHGKLVRRSATRPHSTIKSSSKLMVNTILHCPECPDKQYAIKNGKMIVSSFVFRLANRTAGCMSPALFFQLLFSAIEMAFLCFVVESNVFFSFPPFVANVGSATVLLPTFFYCNLSKAVSTDLSAICDVFYNYSWYLMRANQQKHILFPIRRAQQEFRIKGLGIVQCSLGAFMSVSLSLSFYGWID